MGIYKDSTKSLIKTNKVNNFLERYIKKRSGRLPFYKVACLTNTSPAKVKECFYNQKDFIDDEIYSKDFTLEVGLEGWVDVDAEEDILLGQSDEIIGMVEVLLRERVEQIVSNLSFSMREHVRGRKEYNKRVEDIRKGACLGTGERYVYLFKNEMGLNKIGVSVNPENRLKQIANNSGVRVELVDKFSCYDSLRLERLLHREFVSRRTVGEWFSTVTKDQFRHAINKFYNEEYHFYKEVS